MEDYDKKREQRARYCGVILGLAIVLNFIVGTINDYAPINNLFPIGMFVLGFASLLNSKFEKGSLRVSIKVFVFFLLFGIQVLFSLISSPSQITKYYAQCFFLVGIPAMFLSTRECDYSYTRHSILVISAVCISHFISILSREYTAYTAGEQMGNAYSLLAIFFVAVWTIFDTDDKTLWKVLAGIEGGLCISVFVKVLTRGIWLCIIIFSIFLIYKKVKNQRLKWIMIIGLPIVFVLAIYYIMHALVYTEWYYKLFYTRSADILNGRGLLFQRAFSYRGIPEIFIGSGIGSYYSKYQTYPHNVFAQLYHDQGIFSVLLVIYIMISSAKKTIKCAIKGEKREYLTVLLVCAGFVKIMVSSYFWVEQLFWISMGLLMKEPSIESNLRSC